MYESPQIQGFFYIKNFQKNLSYKIHILRYGFYIYNNKYDANNKSFTGKQFD